MTVDVENIIKQKEFFELSAEELKLVGEYATTEAEYEELKWFLTSAGEAFEADKIEASPELKDKVMSHLTESKKKRGFWMNSVGGFFFPEGKQIYQMPGAQLSIAAALVIGFFLITDPFEGAGSGNDDVAINDVTVQDEDMISGDLIEAAEEEPAEELDNELEESSEVVNTATGGDAGGEAYRSTVEQGPLDATNQVGGGVLSQPAEDVPSSFGYVTESIEEEESDFSTVDGDIDSYNWQDQNKTEDLKAGADKKGAEGGLGLANNREQADEKDRRNDKVTSGNAELALEDDEERPGNTSGGRLYKEAEKAETVDEVTVMAEKKKQNKDFFKRDERQKNGKVTSSVDAPVMDAEPASEDVITKEKIKRKSVHIKGTSELKSLFQTFK